MATLPALRTPLLRAVVVDADHRVRESLAGLLEAEEAIEVVGYASDVPTAVDVCAATDPDVVVLGPSPEGADGPGLLTAIGRCCPDVSVVALLWPNSDGYTELVAGPDAFVFQSADVAELIAQITAIPGRNGSGAPKARW